MEKKRIEKMLEILEKEYPNARIALNFTNPLELLIATILSAQCRDERVNQVTSELFKRYKEARDYAEADIETFERMIRPTGFYKNKARMIIGCCKRLVEEFGGEVPSTVEELTTLPGVGRKTANIVLGNAFGKEAIAVDTHVKRVSKRIGLTAADDPERIEEDLCMQIPEDKWTKATNLLILHGRYTCVARVPFCSKCKINDYCNYWARGERYR